MYTVRKAQDVRERTLTFSKEHFQSNLNDLNNIVARESSLAGVKKAPKMWRALIIGTWQFCTGMCTVRGAQDVRERTLTLRH
jgi:hypothetical protein